MGLGLISAGAGLLKPKVATTTGKLHRTDDDRRDAGFALYYMAINIGTIADPLVTGRLGDQRGWGWHWGFSAAATGTTLGLIQYALRRRHLTGRAHDAEYALAPPALRRAIRLIIAGIAAMGATATTLAPVALSSQTMPLQFPFLPLFLFLPLAVALAAALALALANGIHAQTVKPYDDVSQPASFGVNGAIAMAAGLAVTAAAPWPRRTMHPAH